MDKRLPVQLSMSLPVLPDFATAILSGFGTKFSSAGVFDWVLEHASPVLKHFWNISPDLLDEAPSTAESTTSENEETANASCYLDDQHPGLYKELDNTRAQTRLLYIARAIQRDDPLICNLKSVNVPPSEVYTALSYAWGPDTSRLQSISLDDRPVTVTKNLYQALQELRARNITTVWVDRLCINQQDEIEKPRQLQNMTKVYSWAESVFAWLGSDDSEFTELKHIFDELIEFRKNVGFHGKALTQQFTLHEFLHMWMQQPLSKLGVINIMAGRAR